MCTLAVIAGTAAQTPASAGRVLLVYDMEGVTAAVAPRDVQFGGEGYAATRESLTEDVNAAIRGLLQAGAREVVITDAHGSGNPDPDYLIERLPKGARFDVREAPYDPFLDTAGQGYDAVVAIGMHSGAGSKGFLAHTYFGHTRWRMAGHDMNESMIVAASAARFGVPLVMVTGDDVLKVQIHAFSPATEYVVVKQSEGVERATPRLRVDVTADIEAAAGRAWRKRGQVPPWRPDGTDRAFDNHFSYLFPEMAAVALNFPHVTGVDNKTVNLKSADFVEAYLAFRALANFTQVVRQRMLVRYVGEVDGGRDILAKAQALYPGRDKRTFVPTAAAIDTTGTPYGRHGVR